jgi:hypothetical protein
MKEPDKRPINPDTTKTTKEPKKIRLLPLAQHLYDDFGYIITIENYKDENHTQSN